MTRAAVRTARRSHEGVTPGRSQALVTGTVKDLVIGSDIRFAKRGDHELRGVPDRWKLFAVDEVGR